MPTSLTPVASGGGAPVALSLAKTAEQAGGARAFQSVAQSLAIAVQDATDNLRNAEAISTTATGVAMAQLLATGNVQQYQPVIQQAQTVMTNAIQNFQNTGTAAAAVLQAFVNALPS